MAIRKKDLGIVNGKKTISLEIDNGDLEALNSTMEQYSFIDEQALLRYALVSLLQSDDNKLYVKTDDNIVSIKIANELIKPRSEQGEKKEDAHS